MMTVSHLLILLLPLHLTNNKDAPATKDKGSIVQGSSLDKKTKNNINKSGTVATAPDDEGAPATTPHDEGSPSKETTSGKQNYNPGTASAAPYSKMPNNSKNNKLGAASAAPNGNMNHNNINNKSQAQHWLLLMLKVMVHRQMKALMLKNK